MERFLTVYCERAGVTGLLAEPFNAFTNAGFLLAAALIWRELIHNEALSPRRQWDIVVLTAIVFMIGLGSAAWHVWPIRATLLADVIPITIFIHGFIAAFMVRVMGLSWGWALAIVGLYVAASFSVPSLLSPRALEGTAAYLPAYTALVLTTAVLFWLKKPERGAMLLAIALWTPSLTLRAIDGEVCGAFPLGTHFAWHLLNAMVLYTLLRVLVSSAIAAHRGGEAARQG